MVGDGIGNLVLFVQTREILKLGSTCWLVLSFITKLF